MATNYYNEFIQKLKEIFMMDHAELDFGIYRIMNQKRDEIMKFLDRDLLPQVKEVLSASEDLDTGNITNRLREIEKQLGTKEVADLASSPMPMVVHLVKEYQSLSANLKNGNCAENLQSDVFSHLSTFFSRYYDGGDFISQRRYKDNAYAIPYQGEEVKLYWANADQYYIKTSEYFRDYSFILPTSRKKVHFILKDADTEQNNNKAADNLQHRFTIYIPENDGESTLKINEDEDLEIYFTYSLMTKKTKQTELCQQAYKVISELISEDFGELLSVKCPTKAEPNRTLLEKHLSDYTAKNSFDYFIHKDLGGFLSRELDFYLKNEVLHIDDLNIQHIESQLLIVKAIKQVGMKIIQMLAQLENFQKQLWLKKKFVVQCDYCITLDRIPEKYYAEIIANDAQRKEWVKLFAIDEIKGDLTTEGYSEPLTIEFFQQNPFLVLDTAFFSAKFKHDLLAEFDNIDGSCDGLLINSENFQALNLLQEKYKNGFDATYSDPPYNTGSDGFIYKDHFMHSSWISMMENRLSLVKNISKNKSSIVLSINENELFNLKSLMDCIFENYLTTMAVKVRHEDRILKGDKDFHEVYESALFYGLSNAFKPNKRRKDNTSNDEYIIKIEELEKPSFIIDCGSKLVECFKPDDFKIIKKSIGSQDLLKRISVRGSIREGNSSGRFYVSYLEPIANKYPGYLFKVPNMGDDSLGYRYFQTPTFESKRKNGDYFQGVPKNRNGILEIPFPNYVDFESSFNNVGNEGGIEFRNGKKPVEFVEHILNLQNIQMNKRSFILDLFAGSGSTGHAVIDLNRKEGSRHKYLLCEVNSYFDTTTKPRIEKVIYSVDWRNGKPLSRQGSSHCFKYMRLEQYEDTLNNLVLKDTSTLAFKEGGTFHESYMLNYMLDTETRDSLLNMKWFVNPFAMTLKTTKDNELVDTQVDMVETFNYLIGLNVESMAWFKEDNICVVQGRTHRENLNTLVIWRNCEVIDNPALNVFFEKMDFRTKDSEFDVIYVNGDNTLPNIKRDDEYWKVVLIEEEFTKRMFEEI